MVLCEMIYIDSYAGSWGREGNYVGEDSAVYLSAYCGVVVELGGEGEEAD